MFLSRATVATGRMATSAFRRHDALTAAAAATTTRIGWGNTMMGGVRHLNVHEYISMELMQSHGIQTPLCAVANTPEEAEDIYMNKMNKPGEPLKDVVIKAQVLSGGRGLGTFKSGFHGGVHMVTRKGQAKEYASHMLGQELVTKQAPNGIICNKVLLMERMYMRREMYLSIIMDRASQGPLMVASPHGGTSIEDVAHESPELIFTEKIDLMEGLKEEACNRMASNLGIDEASPAHAKAVTLMQNLYAMFIKCDCTQVEVNPLAETPEGEVVVCDAKVNFDDNAAFRQKSLFEHRDFTQEDPREVEAAKYDLNYVGLDGTIGCMVNGAGLAMSTMDIIQLKGGSPANFLDVGGGANETQVQKAFEILNADPHVKAILVNIFGGIMRCDVIANGVLNAARELGLEKPIIIRLQGTNVEAAKELIANSGYKMIVASDLDDAAEKAVAVAEIIMHAQNINIGVTFESTDLKV